MYCQDCNTSNALDSKYCKECGAKINSGYRTMMLSFQDLPLHQSEEDIDALTRLLDMAFWHNQAGNQAAAMTAAEAALAINPHSTTAHSLLGTLCEKAGQDDDAIKHFEAVLSLNPDSPADAAKLEQLRRGVHVRAVAPPMTHQLLPPALLKLGPEFTKRWAALSETPLSAKMARIDPQRRPLYAAGAATALVAIGGLLLARPWAQAETVRTYAITSPAAPAAVSVASSAYAPPPLLAPVVLAPSHANTLVPTYAPPALTTRDPFAGTVPTDARPDAPTRGAALGSLWSLPPVPRSAAGRRGRGNALPPLRLAALPPVGEGGGLAPASVSLPPGVSPLDAGSNTGSVPGFSGASGAGALPRHTVMVSQFGGSAAPSSTASDLSSHIRITVHQAAETPAPADANSSSGADGDSAQGESLQQRALSLQEAGSYSQARSAYQSAIRSYQRQISAGQNVETAERGLAACQTGLQICQQSQP